MPDRLPVGVLISGRGSNMEALIRAAADPAYPARIALVLSNRADAPGLATARAHGIAVEAMPHQGHSREAHEALMTARLHQAGVHLVALAGYMRVLTPAFIAEWPDRLLNIHPSLLPAFPGLDTHARALAAGCKLHGCTVHFVRAEVDAGPIIAQAAVPVLDDDTPETLAARVLREEHRLIPQAVTWFAEGRLRVDGMRVRVIDQSSRSSPPATSVTPKHRPQRAR